MIKFRATEQPFCQSCRCHHRGECTTGTNVCYSCGQPGHRAATCPTGQTQQVTLPAPPQRLALLAPQQRGQQGQSQGQRGRDQQPPRQQQRGMIAVMTGQEQQALDQRGMQTTPLAGPSTSIPPWAVGIDTATIAEALEDTTNVTGMHASHLIFHVW